MQCLSAIIFVRTEADLLQCPVWVLIVNVVGLDMLKSKLPPGMVEGKHVTHASCIRVIKRRAEISIFPTVCKELTFDVCSA